MAAINSLKAFARASKDEVESDVSRSDLYMINPSRIREEEGFNARGAFCEGDYYERPEVKARIRMFAEAYKRGDHIDPIVVKVIDGEIFVREGHRRLRGLHLAISEGTDIKRTPVFEHKGDEAEQALLVVTSNSGEPLTRLERAVIFARLSSWGWSDQKIATHAGNLHAESVRQDRALLNMPIELKRMVQEGIVAATYAQELFNEHGTKAVEILKNAQAEQSSDNAGKPDAAPKKLTKKSVEKGPRLGKKVVEAMHRGVSSITSRLDSMKASDDGKSFTLTLSLAEVEELQELKAKLAALEPKSDKTDENQQELDLVGNQ